ncbi:hypothetical protein PV-S19_0075 [Pacmanvirus S19]|nr:hypothetical protein PV-S19_0075 [Pacmanvirus S19]
MDNKTCGDCGKVFRDNLDLTRHKNRITPCVIKELTPEQVINPNRCLFCNKIFTSAGNKNKHLKKCAPKNERLANIEYQKDKINELTDMILKQEEIIKNYKEKDKEYNELEAKYKKLEGEMNRLKGFCQKHLDMSGYIYFITEMPFNMRVKIGMSKNPIKRLKTLQTGNPNKLFIYHLFESNDYKVLERSMHDICKDLKLLGEWFEISELELSSLVSGF